MCILYTSGWGTGQAHRQGTCTWFQVQSIQQPAQLFGRQGAPQRRRRLGFIRQARVVADGMRECFRHGQSRSVSPSAVVALPCGWFCWRPPLRGFNLEPTHLRGNAPVPFGPFHSTQPPSAGPVREVGHLRN